MAQHKISGNDVLLFIGDDGISYDTVICLTSNGVTRAVNSIDAATKCGPDTLPGNISNGVSFEGQVMLDPDANYAGIDALDEFWRNKTTVYWKIGPATPVTGDVTYSGTGFISQLDETAAMDAPTTFSGTISVYGTMAKTVTA